MKQRFKRTDGGWREEYSFDTHGVARISRTHVPAWNTPFVCRTLHLVDRSCLPDTLNSWPIGCECVRTCFFFSLSFSSPLPFSVQLRSLPETSAAASHHRGLRRETTHVRKSVWRGGEGRRGWVNNLKNKRIVIYSGKILPERTAWVLQKHKNGGVNEGWRTAPPRSPRTVPRLVAVSLSPPNPPSLLTFPGVALAAVNIDSLPPWPPCVVNHWPWLGPADSTDLTFHRFGAFRRVRHQPNTKCRLKKKKN